MILLLLLPNGWADQGERDSRSGSSEEKLFQDLKASSSAPSLLTVLSMLLCLLSW